MIPLSVPVLGGNELKYVTDCIQSTWISASGGYITQFEKAVGDLVGAEYAVACINGTSALHIALIVSGIQAGDEVLTPTLTFIAPVNAIRYCGASPVFMDCDDFMNLDVAKLSQFLDENCIVRNNGVYNKRSGRRVHAILPVHVFGSPVDMDPLLALAKKYDLRVIEDASESLGSLYKGRPTGTLGDLGCFSFNGNKMITCGGGGMIVVARRDWAEKARYLTTQAKNDELYYIHDNIGYNYRMSNLHAAVGLAQVEKIHEYLDLKFHNYQLYRELLSGIDGLTLLPPPPETKPNHWFYTLMVDAQRFPLDRDNLMGRLIEQGVQVRPVWMLNHEQRPYAECEAYHIEKAPRFQRCALNLPCSVGITSPDIHTVVELIKKC